MSRHRNFAVKKLTLERHSSFFHWAWKLLTPVGCFAKSPRPRSLSHAENKKLDFSVGFFIIASKQIQSFFLSYVLIGKNPCNHHWLDFKQISSMNHESSGALSKPITIFKPCRNSLVNLLCSRRITFSW